MNAAPHVPPVCLLLLALTGAAGAKPRPAPPPAKLTIAAGQTIEDIAERYFDDVTVAREIRALNEIPAGTQPQAGAIVRLPGAERHMAQTALRVAGQALQQARADGAEEFAPAQLARARGRWEQAQQALENAAYDNCRRLADETWALARQARKQSLERRPRKNRFSVSVDAKGITRVQVSEGDGVKVTSGKKSTTVRRGQAVRIQPGKEPEKARPQLPPPEPVLPNDESVLVTPTIYFSWKRVAGAARYVLLISHDPHGLKPVRQLTTSRNAYLFRSSLPDGAYHWFLRTVDGRGLVGTTSPPRQFVLRTRTDGGLSVETVPQEAPGAEKELP